MRYSKLDDYEDYIIYEDGTVWSIKNKKFLKPWMGTKGYNFITLHNKYGSHNFRLHRLIAICFVPNPLNKPDVNHLDENKNNNHCNNLEWVTKFENDEYGTRVERIVKHRTNNPKCCTSVIQYSKDGTFIAQYTSIKEAKQKTGITNISMCCSKRRKTAGGYIWRYKNEVFKDL